MGLEDHRLAHPTASEADPAGSLGSSTVGAGRRGRDSRQSCSIRFRLKTAEPRGSLPIRSCPHGV